MKPGRNYVRDNVPLSRFGVLVAQLESIVASAAQQPPDPLLSFDLFSDLISSIDEEPKESILLWQRKCEDALYSLLLLGARRPVRHLASVAMAKIILKGDGISIYSRASSLQGFLSDGKRSEPQRVAGAAQCLGELYRHFGRRITSGLLETTIIATKLMKFNEEFVRQEALLMLEKALEGSGGIAASSAYTEAFRLITRSAVGDKSFTVRKAAAHCLKAFANIGGPSLGVGELDNSAAVCVKGLEDPVTSVRDAFAEALGSLLALGMNPEAQVQPRGKGPFPPAKKLEGCLQRHLALPFTKASGIRMKDLRIGITLSWVFFLQAIRVKYLLPDSELQNYALQVMDMLRADNAVDAHSLACILYILRVGVTDQMTEPTQRGFLVFLGKQLEFVDFCPSIGIAALHTLSYTLKTLGEVPAEFKEVCDNTVVAAVSHSSQLVRIEAALTLRVLAEVDPTCVGGLISYGVTTLSALRENISFEKGSNLKVGLESLHGQATVLAALVYISPKLPLGYPARLPRSILEVSKKMLEESSRNPVAATVEKESGWLLLSSLLSSMPKQELEGQVFDILSLWAGLFSGNPQQEISYDGDLTSRIHVWSAAIEALSSFVRCFVSPSDVNNGILLQPVMVYLSSALEYLLLLQGNELPNIKQAKDIFVIRTLRAYQSLPEPMAYKSDHPKIIQLCTAPFRDASRCEESTCLRLLLDKRDAWLGPWTPGRDWFEDELRTFQGGKDGIVPCVWENESSNFPQPETINKMLVNQMLLCFGIMFASQDSGGMLSLLGTVEQCLKAGKKQAWHAVSITNICVGLLAGLKALIALRPQPLGPDILNTVLGIFQSILSEGDICASHRRAASEGLGLLARLGNDIFTARMTRLLLNDLSLATDSNYAGSIAFALGCIHRSAGGMALSTLVPATVNSISMLAKSTVSALQIWSLHGLLLTIEAAGFSYVSHVQATLGLAMDILLSEENGLVDLLQGVGRLINAIVAVLGPELAPGSIFFSRCKSVIAEISSQQETAALLESVRFTQQLVLFAPQAVPVHSHVQTLLSTLSSRQPTLRHLAISTLRHLIEKDPDIIIDEQIEDNLFHMLDEETDSEIVNLVRAAIMRLLLASSPSCPSHWIVICRNMILATAARRGLEMNTGLENDSDVLQNDSRSNFGEDDENMVSSSKGMTAREYASETLSVNSTRDKHLRYRTRVFAAECLSYLPSAVGNNPAHFDLLLARKQPTDGKRSGFWLVLYLQELISLAYQISTIQFENMRSIGVGLLSTIVDKFERSLDPELSGHLLLEQYQAQLVSAVRTALDASAGPILLEAGLQLATKIMTSGILGSDQTAVKRIFSMISRPLNDFKDIYYPSFAEWASCKIKVRLLAAHASLKCYTYAFLRRHHSYVPDEYLALLPLFAKSSSVLGKYWIQVLKDYSYICLFLNIKKNWNPFLDGIQSPLVSSKLKSTLEEAWPVILQALALDAVPVMVDVNSKKNVDNIPRNSLISGYSMVELEMEDYRFLWGFGLLMLFQQQHPAAGRLVVPISSSKVRYGEEPIIEETNSAALMLHEIVLPVFQFLSSERFFKAGFLTVDVCQELLQVFSHTVYMDDSWNSLAISVLTQILQNFPESFLESEMFAYLAMELPVAHMFNIFPSTAANSLDSGNMGNLVSPLFNAAKAMVNVNWFEPKVWMQRKSLALALLLLGYKGIRESSTELCYSAVIDFLKSANLLLRKLINGNSSDCYLDWRVILGTCLMVIADLTKDCIKGIHLLEYKRSDARKLLQLKLAFSLEETVLLAKLAYEIEYPGDTEGRTCSTLFKTCVNSARSLLNDSNLQVQAIGLQVLKTMVQRSSNPQECTFLVFLCGELVVEILTLAQTMLKKPMSKEAVPIVGECLRFLVLLQTVPKSSNCQRAFMNLLLKAIILVFSATEDDLSQEAADVKTIAVRLVAHLAQIPSSAVLFKDVLLSMPATQRLQLQGLILASVAQDQTASQTKPVTALEIKLPVLKDFQQPAVSAPPMRDSKENDLVTSAATNHSDRDSADEDQEEEDDWDTFQSFSASSTTIGTELKGENAAEGLDLNEKPKMETRISGSGDLGELHSPQSVINVDVIKDEDHQNAAEEVNSGSEENENEVEEVQIQIRDNVFESCAGQHDMRQEDCMPTIEREEEAFVPSKECAEVNVWEDHEQRKDILDDTDDRERSLARTSGHAGPDEADVQHEAPKVDESEESKKVMASTPHQQKGEEFESPFGGGSVEIEDSGNNGEENREASKEDPGNMIGAENGSVSLQQDIGDHHLEITKGQDKSSK